MEKMRAVMHCVLCNEWFKIILGEVFNPILKRFLGGYMCVEVKKKEKPKVI